MSAESEPAVHFEAAGGVATVTLDRPDSRNALSVGLLNDLGDALAAASSDPAIRVVVLTNAGTTFCAGADLKAALRPGGEEVRWRLPEVLSLILDSPKPVVGRIGGHAMGGGVGLAAACDLSFASSEALFGFTEVRRGVAPAIISVVCLPKLRRGDAAELFLTGRRIPAARAAEVGLITASVAPHDLDAAVESVVSELLAGGPGALAAAKALVLRVPQLGRDDAFAWTAELSAELFASEEAAAGMAAFRDRTDPPWVPKPD
jgi:methylglutaconyl-CoA hydratase